MATAFENFLLKAGKIPGVKVNRAEFLEKTFKGRCVNQETLNKIIELGPINAGIPIAEINKIADFEINNVAIGATAISVITGLPGGLAMLATIPTDLAQIYVHIFIIIQKLMYLYGWEEEVFDDAGNMDTETQTMVVLYIGLMFGVGAVAKPLSQIAAKASVKYINKLASKAALKTLTNKTFRVAMSKIVKTIGLKSVLKGGWKYATKAVPVLGGIFSGVLTLTTIVPMAKKLKKYLSNHESVKFDLADTEDACADDEAIESLETEVAE